MCVLFFPFFLTGAWATADRTEVTNPELTQLTLADLRPAKAYNIRMFAANSVGLSDSSNILTVTTKEAGTVTHRLIFHRECCNFLLDGQLYEFFSPLSSSGSSPGRTGGGPHLQQRQGHLEGRLTLLKRGHIQRYI